MIKFNGKVYSGKNISIINNVVYVDGKRVDSDDTGKTVEIHLMEGATIQKLVVEDALGVTIHGSVSGNVDAGGSVTCGSVGGAVQAKGSVNSKSVGGDVKAGGSVMCGSVQGNVKAGGSVMHN